MDESIGGTLLAPRSHGDVGIDSHRGASSPPAWSRLAPATLPLVAAATLPRLSSDEAAMTRDLYALAELQGTLNGVAWRFRYATRGTVDREDHRVLRIGVSDVVFDVALEEAGPFERLVDELTRAVPPDLWVVYLTGAGAPLWAALESLFQKAVTLVDLSREGPERRPPQAIDFELGRVDGGPLARGSILPHDTRARELLVRASCRAMRPMATPSDTAVLWSAVVGATRLSVGELRRLEANDVVLVDDATCTSDALECWLDVGGARRRLGRAILQQGGLQLIESLDRKGVDMNDPRDEARPAPGGEVGFDGIEVTLHFELARWRAPVDALSRLVPGAVIETGLRIDEPVVTVWADERCIGRGSLVAVGDLLGIRLSSIFGIGGAVDPEHDGMAPTGTTIREGDR